MSYKNQLIIIDEQEHSGEKISQWLKDSSLDIKYFKRVRRGLIEITRSKPKAVVINLDMQDGLQACLEVKDSPLLKETKVLALTTTRSNNNIFDLIFSNTPADYFLSTPIESSYLQELLENIYQTSLPTALFQRTESSNDDRPINVTQRTELKNLREHVGKLEREIVQDKSRILNL